MFIGLVITFIVGLILGSAFMYCDQLEKKVEKLEKENSQLMHCIDENYIRKH